MQSCFEERLEDMWLSLLHYVVGVTVRCPPTSLQAVAGLHYCHSAEKKKKNILGWKQKNHDKRVFESYLLCVCPAFIMGRMCPVSLWLGLLCFGHAFACRWRMEHNETQYCNKKINKWGNKILLGLLFWKDQSNAGHGKRQVAVPKLCFTFKLIWNQNLTLA